ncbi:hypothetical protein NLX83_04765 [Allokutzneria sp. A3M-2-11 16]|uniref:hypothetical protein n=1 Tax=Allokutzneria sp. A3M-2-11 16 TaxID=2962043 RepID=UPI0020B6C493|nr:hypothetical protein [Allokutzneria sp. A3M-2-11 16]MCP3798565.1 hypothetical protein [Allokutzneria sp. A3M-2-11 16]
MSPAIGRRNSLARRLLSGVAGSLAAGMAVLALAMVIAQVYAGATGIPGPGVAEVVGHLVVAAVMVVLQQRSDHEPGRIGLAMIFGVYVIAAATLWFWWWS